MDEQTDNHGEPLDVKVIWERFLETHEESLRSQLRDHYMDIVRYSAERLHTKLPDKVNVEDLFSAGTFGLEDAIDNYNPSRGVKFETYCAPYVKGAILDELRNIDWVPRLVRARANQLKKMTAAQSQEYGLEDQLGSEKVYNGLTSDSSRSPTDQLRIDQQKQDLKNILTKGISRAERIIIILYYYEEMTMKEIGATLELSESRVSQMHGSIVARIKGMLNTPGRYKSPDGYKPNNPNPGS